MLSKEQANLEAAQLIQQDAQLNLQKIAKLNSFQLWLFKNKLCRDVPLDQQYFLLRIAKQNADEFQLNWISVVGFIVIILAILFGLIFVKDSNFFWLFTTLLSLFLLTFIRYVKIRVMYKELLRTHLVNIINE